MCLTRSIKKCIAYSFLGSNKKVYLPSLKQKFLNSSPPFQKNCILKLQLDPSVVKKTGIRN